MGGGQHCFNCATAVMCLTATCVVSEITHSRYSLLTNAGNYITIPVQAVGSRERVSDFGHSHCVGMSTLQS